MHSYKLDSLMQLKDILKNHGTVVINKNFISQEFWTSLDELTTENNLPYSVNTQGDTAEKCTTHFFRVKKTGEKEIYNQAIMDLIVSPELMHLYNQITDLSNIEIDRAQAHIYKHQGFLAPHVDTESVPSYLYTMVFTLTDDYEGGEFVVKNKYSEKSDSFDPEKYSLIITRSDFQHEVKRVTRGIRRVFVAFIQPIETAKFP